MKTSTHTGVNDARVRSDPSSDELAGAAFFPPGHGPEAAFAAHHGLAGTYADINPAAALLQHPTTAFMQHTAIAQVPRVSVHRAHLLQRLASLVAV